MKRTSSIRMPRRGTSTREALLSDPALIGLAIDFYAPLLTARRRRALELHFEEDLSYAEVSVKLGDARGGTMTRQGAQRHIQSGVADMIRYEDRLGLVARHIKSRARLLKLSRGLMNREISSTAAAKELVRMAEAL